MHEQPILTLGTRIGIDPEAPVCISHYNDTTPWTPLHVPLKLADAVTRALTDRGMNVYLMVNETVENMSSPRGTAADVTRLRAVYADLDVKAGGLPSFEAAQNVIDMLSDIINCKPTVTVMSGHGLQPYWEVEDGQISDDNRPYVAGILKRWGLLVQRLAEIEGGKADNVYDLPRVLRAPGSRNMKDPASPIEVTMETNDWTHPVTLRELVEAVESYGFVNDLVTVDEFQILSDPSTWEPAELDCMWSQTIMSQILSANPDARHPWLLAMAVKIECACRYGCITENTYGDLVRALETRFMALLATGTQPRVPAPGEVNTAFKWARARVAAFSDTKLRDNVDYHSHKPSAEILPFVSSGQELVHVESDAPPAPTLAPVVLDDRVFDYTDTANSERLARMALGKFIYVPGIGWHIWQQGRYVKDDAESIVRLAIASVREAADNDPSKDGVAWAQLSLGAGKLAASVRLAESQPELVVPTTKLDNNPLELCTPGGIVSLRDGHLRQAHPATDHNTRQTSVTPQFGPMPRFTKFLNQILSSKDEPHERIDYVKRLFGVALIGELRWQILPIFSGSGANGKSALLEIIGGCLGSYSAVMPENFLLESARMEHSTEIARLRGVRLAIASETKPDGKFNESRVKMLTGEGVLSARGMRQDFFDFPATHTLFLALNHPPQVKTGGEGFWRRIRKIDFTYWVPPHERNENFAKELIEEEGPAILQWCIEGAMEVLQDGLVEPLSVEMATLSYRAEEDHIDTFLQDCTAKSPESGFTTMELYSVYQEWCRKNGELPIGSTSLIRDLKSRLNLTPYRNKRTRGYTGLMILVDWNEKDQGAPPTIFGKAEDVA